MFFLSFTIYIANLNRRTESIQAKKRNISVKESVIIEWSRNIVAKGKAADQEGFVRMPQCFKKLCAAYASAGGKE